MRCFQKEYEYKCIHFHNITEKHSCHWSWSIFLSLIEGVNGRFAQISSAQFEGQKIKLKWKLKIRTKPKIGQKLSEKQSFWTRWSWCCWLDLNAQCMDVLCVLECLNNASNAPPIQLPTLWDAVFIEFSLAHFLWLSYQPTRASSFLKYSANLKEESRFWEKIWFFPQAFQRTAQIVDHWGFVKLEFCETWSILWKQKIENSFSSAHVCLPLLLRNEGLFPVLTWRQYSMERSWRYWNCLSQTFFPFGSRPFNSQVVFPGEYIFKKDVKNVRNGRSLG